MPVTFRGRSWKLSLRGLLRSSDPVDGRESRHQREATYGAALALDPSLKHSSAQDGHALNEQGRFDDAEQAYRRSLALDATLADTNLQLGHLLKRQGRA